MTDRQRRLRNFKALRRTLLVVTFILSLPLICLGQQVRPDKTRKATRAIRKMEDKWTRAVLHRDVKSMDRLLANEYIGVGSNGEVRDKTQTPTDFRSSPLGFDVIALGDFDLRVEGDLYVISGRVRMRVVAEDQSLAHQYRYVKVYVKRRWRWQVIALHMMRLIQE